MLANEGSDSNLKIECVTLNDVIKLKKYLSYTIRSLQLTHVILPAEGPAYCVSLIGDQQTYFIGQ